MKQHTPYEVVRKHPEDFRVEYEFIKHPDGSFIQRPFQGMRCDFSYEGDDIENYMIHPEFEDENGSVITNLDAEIQEKGIAKMWVLIPEMREKIHRTKAFEGAICYFKVGAKIIAKAKIIEIVGLNENPS